MSIEDISWTRDPARLEVTGKDALVLPANKPVLHRTVETAKIYEDLDYLPATPHLSGIYIYLNLVYPLIKVPFSLFELYHSEVGINLRPKLYVTAAPVLGLAQSAFDGSKEAHRLIWVNDDAEAIRFLDFISTYVFKREVTKELFATTRSVLPLRYPDGGPTNRGISCVYVMPYSIRGGFVHDQMASAGLPYPVFASQAAPAHAEAEKLRQTAEAMWP